VSERTVYVNGTFVPEAEASVPLYDSALQIGDMAFEVTRTFRQKPYRLREHLTRLSGSLQALRITCGHTIDQLERITDEVLARNLPTEADSMDWQIIHNVSRGPSGMFAQAYPPERRRPTVIISCFPIAAKLASVAERYTTGVDLVVPRQRAIPPELLPTHIKTRGRLHYKLADLEVEHDHPGCQAVLMDPSGQITEGTSSNVFLVADGVVKTPPSEAVLLGVTRGLILDLCERLDIPEVERRLEPSDFMLADEVFVTSTSIGLLHVRSFQGELVGSGKIGPISTRLRQALDEEVGLSFADQAREFAALLRGTA
jgi:branched-chain amino acid aminotransferase